MPPPHLLTPGGRVRGHEGCFWGGQTNPPAYITLLPGNSPRRRVDPRYYFFPWFCCSSCGSGLFSLIFQRVGSVRVQYLSTDRRSHPHSVPSGRTSVGVRSPAQFRGRPGRCSARGHLPLHPLPLLWDPEQMENGTEHDVRPGQPLLTEQKGCSSSMSS